MYEDLNSLEIRLAKLLEVLAQSKSATEAAAAALREKPAARNGAKAEAAH